MMGRRGALRALGLLGLGPLAMRGTGGTPPQPAGYVPPTLPGQAAGSRSNVFRRIIVAGPGEGLFAYSPSLGAGNLIATSGIATAGTDVYGNIYLAGDSSYGSGIASSLTAGGISFYIGSLASGWTFQATINYHPATSELFVAAGQVEFNAALLHADGTLQVDGIANLNGTQVNMPNATSISAPLATAINFDTATIDLMNGNLNLNMADPPNTAAVIAGTATQAQYNACLGGMLNSMKNRKLFA